VVMVMRWGRFSVEVAFVISMITVLKGWVFPFFISIWFPTNELSSRMYDWTAIVVGMITCFIYFSFGSVTKYEYHFSWLEGILFFSFLHFFMIFEVFGEFSRQWGHLFGDLITLFIPFVHLEGLQLFFIYLFFFLLGKGVRIREKEIKERSSLFIKGK
jgi:hypothetical protein